MLTTPSVLGVYGHFPIARPPPSSVPDSVDANHVLPAEVQNRTQHDCLTARPHTEFSGYVLGDTGAGLAAHETQGLPYLAIRKDVDERGLSQLYRQSLLHGTVKNYISSCVVEIGQDDGVLLREERSLGRWNCRARAPVEATGDQGDEGNHHSRNQNLPPSTHRWSRRRCLPRRNCRLLLSARCT